MRFLWLIFSLFFSLMGSMLAHAATAPQRIEFWTMSLKPKFIPYFDELVRDYNASHPKVQVVWVDFPWDILQLKLITAIAAGKPPSLVQLSVPWAEEMARDGLLVAVDPWLAVPGQAPTYTSAALADLRFGAHYYGFPHYSNVNVIAYHRALLQLAGITRAPRDLDEVLNFAATIAAKTGKPGYAPALGKIDGFFLQQGLPLIQNRRAAFNSVAHIALLEKLAACYRANGLLKEKLFAEDNFPAVLDAYLGGRLAMMVSAPTALKRVQVDAPEIYAQTGIYPMPTGPTGIVDGGWMFHFAVPKGIQTPALPAVAEFARHLTGAKQQKKFAELAGVMPTIKAALSIPSKMSDDPSLQAQAVAAKSIEGARSLYVSGVDDYDELRRVLVQAVEAGITGKRAVKPALDEAAAHWNRKLATGL